MLTALLSVLALGFLLGMRHATDPDHVVAVTTIVTQQRSLGLRAMLCWMRDAERRRVVG